MGERYPLGEVCRSLGIPKEVIDSYLKMGISTLYDWQVKCLTTTGVLSNQNLVYCAPTGGGKTLIAEFAILNAVLVTRKKAIFVLPFVSLVLEKEKYFKKLLNRINSSRSKRDKVRVKGYYGDLSVMTAEREDILICTIEKANGLINNFIMRGRADRIGCIVMDEMHALGALFNGYLLEILISKVLFLEHRVTDFAAAAALAASGKQQQHTNRLLRSGSTYTSAMPILESVRIQLIAMSATVGNVAELAAWFGNTQPFISEYRPVLLFEKIVAGDQCCNRKGSVIVEHMPLIATRDSEREKDGRNTTEEERVLASLVGDGLRKGQQVLLFCPSKLNCLHTCTALMRLLCPQTHGQGQGEQRGGQSGSERPSSLLSASLLTGSAAVSAAAAVARTLDPDPELAPDSGERFLDRSRVFISHERYSIDIGNNNNSSSNSNSNSNQQYQYRDVSNSNVAISNAQKKQVLQRKIESERAKSISSILSASPQADPSLLSFMGCGVAYHHAGLSLDERAEVEAAFKSGSVSVLVATSTLAAGVNLPAGRVVIRSLKIGAEALGVVQYRQMVGRAGRPGFTPSGGRVGEQAQGESYLVVGTKEKDRAVALIQQPLPCVLSQMHPKNDGGKGLLKAVLEMYGLSLCSNIEHVRAYVRHTLLWFQARAPTPTPDKACMYIPNPNVAALMPSCSAAGGRTDGLQKSVEALVLSSSSSSGSATVAVAVEVDEAGAVLCVAEEAMAFLVEARALGPYSAIPHTQAQAHPPTLQQRSAECADPVTEFKISRFGRAAMQSGLSPDEAIMLYEDLSRALSGVNLESDLHLLYLMTPQDRGLHPDFQKLYKWYTQCQRRPPNQDRSLCAVCDSAGISEMLLSKWSYLPPTRATVTQSSATVKGISLTRWAQDKPSSRAFLPESEWKALSRCRRLWAAMALGALLRGQGLAEVGGMFECEGKDLEDLQRGAKLNSGRVQRFCSEVGWAALERLINNFKSTLDSSVPKELLSLVAVPHVTVKVAKVLVESRILTCRDLSRCSVPCVVRCLHLSLGFEKQLLEHFFVEGQREAGKDKGKGNLTELVVEEGAVHKGGEKDKGMGGGADSGGGKTRDEEVLSRLSAFASCLISGAKILSTKEQAEDEKRAAHLMAAIEEEEEKSRVSGVGDMQDNENLDREDEDSEILDLAEGTMDLSLEDDEEDEEDELGDRGMTFVPHFQQTGLPIWMPAAPPASFPALLGSAVPVPEPSSMHSADTGDSSSRSTKCVAATPALTAILASNSSSGNDFTSSLALGSTLLSSPAAFLPPSAIAPSYSCTPHNSSSGYSGSSSSSSYSARSGSRSPLSEVRDHLMAVDLNSIPSSRPTRPDLAGNYSAAAGRPAVFFSESLCLSPTRAHQHDVQSSYAPHPVQQSSTPTSTSASSSYQAVRNVHPLALHPTQRTAYQSGSIDPYDVDPGIGTGIGIRTGEGIGTRTGEGIGIRTGEGIGMRTGEGIGTRTGEGIGMRTGEGIGIRTGEGIGMRTGEGIGIRTGEGPEAAKSKLSSVVGSARAGDMEQEMRSKVPRIRSPLKSREHSNTRSVSSTDAACLPGMQSGGVNEHGGIRSRDDVVKGNSHSHSSGSSDIADNSWNRSGSSNGNGSTTLNVSAGAGAPTALPCTAQADTSRNPTHPSTYLPHRNDGCVQPRPAPQPHTPLQTHPARITEWGYGRERDEVQGSVSEPVPVPVSGLPPGPDDLLSLDDELLDVMMTQWERGRERVEKKGVGQMGARDDFEKQLERLSGEMDLGRLHNIYDALSEGEEEDDQDERDGRDRMMNIDRSPCTAPPVNAPPLAPHTAQGPIVPGTVTGTGMDTDTDCVPFTYEGAEDDVKPHDGPFSPLHSPLGVHRSPYAQPFTASKMKSLTPGNFYLYLPQLSSGNVDDNGDGSGVGETDCPSSSSEVGIAGREGTGHKRGGSGDRRARDVITYGTHTSSIADLSLPTPQKFSESSVFSPIKMYPLPPRRVYAEDVALKCLGYGWRHVGCEEHCKAFLQLLSCCRCVSFELLYRRVPYGALGSGPGGGHQGYLQGKVKTPGSTAPPEGWLGGWGRTVAWSCPKSASASVGGVCGTTSLCLDQEMPPERTKMDDPHVLSGIAFCFGDEYGYYLPLPCIPALLALAGPHTAHNPTHTTSHSNSSSASSAPCCQLSIKNSSDEAPDSHPRSTANSSHSSSHSFLASMNGLPILPLPPAQASTGHEWDPSVLICRFVGFPLILDKCPYLKSAVCVTVEKSRSKKDGALSGIEIQVPSIEPPRSYKEWAEQQKNKEESKIKIQNSGTSLPTSQLVRSARTAPQSNPLVCVSKHWARACRAAMLLEWRRGGGAEWRVLGEIMSSSRVTKVGFDLKSQLVSLRERDVVVCGLLEDPTVAACLLFHCMGSQAEAEARKQHVFALSMPSAAAANGTGAGAGKCGQLHGHQHHHLQQRIQAQRTSCFRAVAVMRAMARLTPLLRTHEALRLFRDIEMPLLLSVADAEYSGFPVSPPFFAALKQDLGDRIRVIEGFFRAAGGLNPASPQEMTSLKSRLAEQRRAVLREQWEIFVASATATATESDSLRVQGAGAVGALPSGGECIGGGLRLVPDPGQQGDPGGVLGATRTRTNPYPPLQNQTQSVYRPYTNPPPYPPASQPALHHTQPAPQTLVQVLAQGQGQFQGKGQGPPAWHQEPVHISQSSYSSSSASPYPPLKPSTVCATPAAWLIHHMEHPDRIAAALARHPLLQMVTQYRLHVVNKNLCGGIHFNQAEGRVKALYNPAKARTGRFSVSSPALQMVAKGSISYVTCLRRSIQREIADCLQITAHPTLSTHPGGTGRVYVPSRNSASGESNSGLNQRGKGIGTGSGSGGSCVNSSDESMKGAKEERQGAGALEAAIRNVMRGSAPLPSEGGKHRGGEGTIWVRVCRMRAKQGLDGSGLVLPLHSLGVLQGVEPVNIEAPPVRTGPTQGSAKDDKDGRSGGAAAPKNSSFLTRIDLSASGRSRSRGRGPALSLDEGAEESLAELWRGAGHRYGPEDSDILQALVSLPGSSSVLPFPADKVSRLSHPPVPWESESRAFTEALGGGMWRAEFRDLLRANMPGAGTQCAVPAPLLAIPTPTPPEGQASLKVRDGFKASAGYTLLAADYSQIELRIMAHFSKDVGLCAAFRSDVDVFRSLAAQWKGLLECDVSDSQRAEVKQVCYALMYGSGDARNAESMGISEEQARRLKREFLAQHPALADFTKAAVRSCRARGFAETILGRRRVIEDILSEKEALRRTAERQAVNTVCQGSSADLIKLAMINIHHRLAELSSHLFLDPSPDPSPSLQGTTDGAGGDVTLPSTPEPTPQSQSDLPPLGPGFSFRQPRSFPGGGLYERLCNVRLVLQMHDELIYEVRNEDLHAVSLVVQRCMEGAATLCVPLQVKMKAGPSWGSLEDYPARSPTHSPQGISNGSKESKGSGFGSGSGPSLVVRDIFGRQD